MADYAAFARFYDDALGGLQPNSARVLAAIERYLPRASSLLELGCGTGSVLAGLTALDSLTGLDRCAEMLAIARSKVPSARFVEGDMTSFRFDDRFDVVVCVFDTLNHLTDFDQWTVLFRRVAEHLGDGGLFVFDVNTMGKLASLAAGPPWVCDLRGHTIVQHVEPGDGALWTWHVRIFEHLGGRQFVLHHERILELGVELERIKAALARWFDVLEESDPRGEPADDESVRAHFVARRAGPRRP